MTFMPNASARQATSRAMRPMPTRPKVLPASSLPSYFFLFHWPLRMVALAMPMKRATENM